MTNKLAVYHNLWFNIFKIQNNQLSHKLLPYYKKVDHFDINFILFPHIYSTLKADDYIDRKKFVFLVGSSERNMLLDRRLF